MLRVGAVGAAMGGSGGRLGCAVAPWPATSRAAPTAAPLISFWIDMFVFDSRMEWVSGG
jgi:hypothetical protein